jgi:hypothetical protein
MGSKFGNKIAGKTVCAFKLNPNPSKIIIIFNLFNL